MSTEAAQLDRAVDLIQSGGLVAFPTETVYGLGADATNPEAVQLVYETKQRPAANPLIVHVADIAMAQRVVLDWPDRAQKLAASFWPGPLSFILPKAPSLPGIVAAGGSTVAVRCPDHQLALSLIGTCNLPLVAPSANPSGGISPTTADHVRASFSENDVFVLDGGPCRAGIESTVIDLTQHAPRLLRLGIITPDAIARVLGEPVTDSSSNALSLSNQPLPSPGLLARHYAPKAPAQLFTNNDWPALLQRYAQQHLVVITHDATLTPPTHTATLSITIIRLPGEAMAYARELYTALREADAINPACIAIHKPEPVGEQAPIWSAILDRLTRATTPVEHTGS